MNDDRMQKLKWEFEDNIHECHDKYYEAQKSLREQFNEEIYGINYDYIKKLEKLLRELNEADTDESEK